MTHCSLIIFSAKIATACCCCHVMLIVSLIMFFCLNFLHQSHHGIFEDNQTSKIHLESWVVKLLCVLFAVTFATGKESG